MNRCDAEDCSKKAENTLSIQRHSFHKGIGYMELKLCSEHLKAELESLLKDGDFAAIIVEKGKP